MRPPAIVRALLLASAAWLLAQALARVGVVGDLLVAVERKSLDYRMARYRGARLPPGTAPSGIVIVAVDERSLEALGRFPSWPREYHARLLERLDEGGARIVVFDLLFAEPDALPGRVREVRATEIARATGVQPAAAADLLAAWGGDQAFATRMRAHGRVILAADPASDALPVPVLAAAAAALGHVSTRPDPDGILRRVAASSGDVRPLPALGVAAARAMAPGVLQVEDGEVLLDYAGPRGAFVTLSYADVLEGRVPPELLRDRLVFVGATAAGLGDVFATPFSADMPGVEAHATLAHQLLEGRVLRQLPRPAAFASQIVLALVATVAVGGAPGVLAAVLAAGAAATYVLACFEVFVQTGTEVPFAFPLLAWTVASLGAGAWRYTSEERGRRRIQHAFGRYLAPEVVEEIARDPEALRLGGESRDVTIGFVDIRGFTALTHALGPEDLARFLHAFFTAVEEEIHARRGTVDKYIGDAVMMLFGAPNQLPDASLRACEAAWGIVDAVHRRADEWRALGVPDLRVGVGIEAGPSVVGNLGSERRFDYTALGDAVNVAARLQELNKELGTTILVGPGVRARVGDALPFRRVDSRALRGRAGVVDVFELPVPERATRSFPPSAIPEGAPHG